MAAGADDEWDYVLVGTGAGGGTLAARLAEQGQRVFVIEAGSDPDEDASAADRADYEVPAFHTFACENDAMRWSFHVRHYEDEERQARDPKYEPGAGVLYPRAATVGGCTAHNAMIWIRPHDSDWDGIARLTRDPSWSASRMRRYARRIEDCRHQPLWRAVRGVADPTGHGWNGWLPIEKFLPLDALADDSLLSVFAETTRRYARTLATPLLSTARWLREGGDPNGRRWWTSKSFEGLCYTPLSTADRKRVGTRERLRDVRARHRDRLHVETDALATRVVIEGGRARGVAFLKGPHLYRAHAAPSESAGEERTVRARREVVLCGGAFNTPQLLMLSGIGPAQHLRSLGIEPVVDLPAVGGNLQDRYEVAITHRMAKQWSVLDGARFEVGDPLYERWSSERSGMYASNGAAVAVIGRSAPARGEPDLFMMALLARFEGYRPGFSEAVRAHHDALTWAVLKAHTENRAGTVRLRSRDPRDPPEVVFRYFDEGSDRAGDDLASVVAAIRFVRTMTAGLIERGVIAEELAPGPGVVSDEDLATYVRDTAWGHHASCSCPIGGPDEPGALDSDFRVRGVDALRVVDASIFPRIPGFFIAAAIYMAAEKAADVILRDARRVPST